LVALAEHHFMARAQRLVASRAPTKAAANDPRQLVGKSVQALAARAVAN
jgi:hypothetical protein